MRHMVGEKMVKGLQKEFLSWIENHESLQDLRVSDRDTFNIIRKRVFRSTFDAYILGVRGVAETDTKSLWHKFIGWLEQDVGFRKYVADDVRIEVMEKCFRTALEAFRVGAMVSESRQE